jgi:hypothetical protein
MCGADVPGDTYRNLQIFPEYSGRTFKHILLPLWLLTYTFGAAPYQVLVNGYTGKMDGTYPVSWWKIAGLVILALIVIAIVIALEGS